MTAEQTQILFDMAMRELMIATAAFGGMALVGYIWFELVGFLNYRGSRFTKAMMGLGVPVVSMFPIAVYLILT